MALRELPVMDVDEFEVLVRSLERPLGSFLAQMIPSCGLAEEVLQEAMLVAWRERARMPAEPEVRRAWMYGVARNQALHALRKGRRGRAALEELERAAVPYDHEVESEALAMRDLLVRTLRPADRSLFVLRYVHGFTAESLADMTGRRPAAVRKRLERAAAALRAVLEKDTTLKEDDHGRSVVVA